MPSPGAGRAGKQFAGYQHYNEIIMFTYREILSFLRLHGPLPLMARDRSGIRPAVHIREDSFLMTKIQLEQLKDGPERNWVFSIKVEPSA